VENNRQGLSFGPPGLTIIIIFKRPVTPVTACIAGLCLYHPVDATFLTLASDTHFEPPSVKLAGPLKGPVFLSSGLFQHAVNKPGHDIGVGKVCKGQNKQGQGDDADNDN